MMFSQLDMFSKAPCIDLIVLQDNFAKSNTDEFEKLFFLHSYAQALGDYVYAQDADADRFSKSLALIFGACLENPTSPMSEVVRGLGFSK